MRSLSVLLVCHSYPPMLGGSEIEAERVCRALSRRGTQVTVWTAGHAEMPDQREWIDEAGVKVRVIGKGTPRRWLDHVFAAGVGWRLARERKSFDVVYFLMQGLHLAVGLPVARAARLPIVMKISGSGIVPMMLASRLGGWELRRLNDWAHRVMILNDGIADEAVAGGIARERLVWMPNPVDVEEFAPAADKAALRRELGFEAAARVVAYVGRLAEEKELPTLLSALARLKERYPEARAVLVGDGPERGALERQVNELGLADRVVFTGRQPIPNVIRYLQASDVFALLSEREGFPCALAEAMAVGMPSLVSRIPANEQLVREDVEGRLVGYRDVEATTKALEDLLCAPAVRAAEMGRRARQVILENYSTELIAQRYEDLFKEAVEAGGGRGLQRQ